MLNPDLDITALAEEYRQDDRIRISNIFTQGVAERVRECCLSQVPFDFIFHEDGQNRVVSAGEMSTYDTAQQKALETKIMRAASKGIGFLYCGYMLNRPQQPQNESLAFLHDMFAFLKKDETLSVFRQITGQQELTNVDAQYTRYTKGHFLTRHSDKITSEQRRIAFVFGFSTQWHPDWGGLLQFYENDGTPRDAWMPEFNTLSLFDVRHIHSVSYLTPFAEGQRLSLTGWFTNSRPDG
ncbi:MAG: 2OG-Fe(II) oxygenase [Proteobacteria bacterium]|nr:2OG-Fe(II) oxygenase [Pseudomonadota bacterium]